jgi:ribosome recycling factor
MHDLRELREGGDVGEDEERRAESELQKVTDAKIADLEGHLKAKEAEIMEV